jgi:hypothetical protein
MTLITASCRLPCVTADPEEIPGVIPDFGTEAGSGAVQSTDENATAVTATTDATATKWSVLMAADADRLGAAIQNHSAGSLFIAPYATGLPADGSLSGEVEIPPTPTQYIFPFSPRKRYIIRGSAATLSYTLETW